MTEQVTVLRQVRREKFKTTTAFSRRIGINSNTACQIELRKTAVSAKWRKIFAKVLGVKEGRIFDKENFAIWASE